MSCFCGTSFWWVFKFQKVEQKGQSAICPPILGPPCRAPGHLGAWALGQGLSKPLAQCIETMSSTGKPGQKKITTATSLLLGGYMSFYDMVATYLLTINLFLS